MAARFSSTIVRNSSVAANLQGWAQFFEDTLVTTGGWGVTADTGQTLPSALAACIAVNSKKGYRIYTMSDSLQATSPVFMRVDFGCGGNIVTSGLWITIGTGSDGAGNITGVLWNGGASATPNVMNNTTGASTASNSYGSADTSRASMAICVNVNSGYVVVFCIERSKDALGNNTGDGLLLIYNDTSANLGNSRYIVLGGGPQPTVETGLNYILTWLSSSETFGGNIGVGVVTHFKGVAQQPGMNMLICATNDVATEGTFSTVIYGSSRTYVRLNVFPPVKAQAGGVIQVDGNARICMRYD